MTKKFLVYLAIAAVALSAGLSGLAILPHTHGEDSDHSQNAGCVVYQYEQSHANDFAQISAVVFILLLGVVGSLLTKKAAPVSFTRHFASLRAPPTIS